MQDELVFLMALSQLLTEHQNQHTSQIASEFWFSYTMESRNYQNPYEADPPCTNCIAIYSLSRPRPNAKTTDASGRLANIYNPACQLGKIKFLKRKYPSQGLTFIAQHHRRSTRLVDLRDVGDPALVTEITDLLQDFASNGYWS